MQAPLEIKFNCNSKSINSSPTYWLFFSWEWGNMSVSCQHKPPHPLDKSVCPPIIPHLAPCRLQCSQWPHSFGLFTYGWLLLLIQATHSRNSYHGVVVVPQQGASSARGELKKNQRSNHKLKDDSTLRRGAILNSSIENLRTSIGRADITLIRQHS